MISVAVFSLTFSCSCFSEVICLKISIEMIVDGLFENMCVMQHRLCFNCTDILYKNHQVKDMISGLKKKLIQYYIIYISYIL